MDILSSVTRAAAAYAAAYAFAWFKVAMNLMDGGTSGSE